MTAFAGKLEILSIPVCIVKEELGSFFAQLKTSMYEYHFDIYWTINAASNWRRYSKNN